MNGKSTTILVFVVVTPQTIWRLQTRCRFCVLMLTSTRTLLSLGQQYCLHAYTDALMGLYAMHLFFCYWLCCFVWFVCGKLFGTRGSNANPTWRYGADGAKSQSRRAWEHLIIFLVSTIFFQPLLYFVIQQIGLLNLISFGITSRKINPFVHPVT